MPGDEALLIGIGILTIAEWDLTHSKWQFVAQKSTKS
jgi:hypothetical protein